MAANGICPAPHPRPIAPASHNDVPVVMLRTLPSEVNIRPAARNATPAVTASIIRSGSFLCSEVPPKSIAASSRPRMTNRQAATETRMWVLRPAGFSRRSLSRPIMPAKIIAARSRASAAGAGTTEKVYRNSLTTSFSISVSSASPFVSFNWAAWVRVPARSQPEASSPRITRSRRNVSCGIGGERRSRFNTGAYSGREFCKRRV